MREGAEAPWPVPLGVLVSVSLLLAQGQVLALPMPSLLLGLPSALEAPSLDSRAGRGIRDQESGGGGTWLPCSLLGPLQRLQPWVQQGPSPHVPTTLEVQMTPRFLSRALRCLH